MTKIQAAGLMGFIWGNSTMIIGYLKVEPLWTTTGGVLVVLSLLVLMKYSRG